MHFDCLSAKVNILHGLFVVVVGGGGGVVVGVWVWVCVCVCVCVGGWMCVRARMCVCEKGNKPRGIVHKLRAILACTFG